MLKMLFIYGFSTDKKNYMSHVETDSRRVGSCANFPALYISERIS